MLKKCMLFIVTISVLLIIVNSLLFGESAKRDGVWVEYYLYVLWDDSGYIEYEGETFTSQTVFFICVNVDVEWKVGDEIEEDADYDGKNNYDNVTAYGEPDCPNEPDWIVAESTHSFRKTIGSQMWDFELMDTW